MLRELYAVREGVLKDDGAAAGVAVAVGGRVDLGRHRARRPAESSACRRREQHAVLAQRYQNRG